MTVEHFAKEFGYDVLCMPQPEKNINGGYVGDLLSWVMGKLDEDDAWVTIMSNINIVAVASLADPACIVLAENVLPDNGVVEKALEQGVNILRTNKPSFDACIDIKSVL